MRPHKFDHALAAEKWRSRRYASITALARELDASREAVARALRAYGALDLAPRAITEERAAEVRARVAAGESETSVAKVMTMSPRSIRRIVGREARKLEPPKTRRERAVAMKRADPKLSATACAKAIGSHMTSVQCWWGDAGLTPQGPGQKRPAQDPFIDLLHVEYRDIDVSDEWRRVGLPRWAYVPPRVASSSGLTSCEWMA